MIIQKMYYVKHTSQVLHNPETPSWQVKISDGDTVNIFNSWFETNTMYLHSQWYCKHVESGSCNTTTIHV